MEHATEVHRGGCLCGAVRYSIAEGAVRTGICHCRTCRDVASAPSLPFTVFPSRTFVFETGQPTELRSSQHVIRRFCGACGSPLTYANGAELEFIDVMTVSLDRPDAYPPTYHVWTSQKIGWDVIGDGLPAYEKGRE